MQTVILVVWMTVSGQNVMSVQELPTAGMCESMRTNILTQSNVTGAQCDTDDMRATKVMIYAKKCSVLEVSERYANFTCAPKE